MATLPLPQTNPQGGPNPNSPPVIRPFPDPTAAVPSLAGSLQGGALATQQPPAPAPALPAYDPNAGAYVDPTRSGLGNLVQGFFNRQHAANISRTVDPGIPGAIANWMFNPVGGPAAQNYQDRVQATQTLNSDAAQGYLSAHPDQLTAAHADPVAWARSMGPIFEAAHLTATGQAIQDTHVTANGEAKADPNPQMTKAIAEAHGVHPDAAHAIANPTAYTTDQFVNATLGMTKGQMKNIWQMQHYLDPQQQAHLAYLSSLNKDYANAEKGNAPDAALQQYENALRSFTFNNPYLPPR